MSATWKEVRLSDVCEIRRGSSPRPIVDFLSVDGMPWVKISDATESDSRFIDETKECIKPEGVPKSVIVEKGDLILSNSGTAGLPKFMGITACIHDGWQTLRKLNGIDKDFLYYTLLNIRRRLLHNAYNNVLTNLTLEMLREATIELPPLEEQRELASVLSTIDEKIELNRKQNRTLEAIAQTLFKHWFVDFEFPDENGRPYKSSGGAMQPSELGEIPVGWEVVKIGDAVEILGGGTPSTKNSEYWHDGMIDWYSPTDLTKSGALYSIGSGKQITKSGLENSSAKLFPAYSLMMTSRATIGVVSINRTEACTNQGFITLIPNSEFSLYQLHGWLLQNLPLVHSKSSGSTFKEISRGTFKEFEILRSPVSDKFANLIEPFYQKIETNILEAETLTKLRDTLLPKLMSGELRVAQENIK